MKLDSFKKIAAALHAAEVRYLIAGGLAVVAHGYGRLTVDIDLFVELESGTIKKAFAALEKLGYRPRVPVTAAEFADEETRRRWIVEKGMQVLNLCSEEHRETPIDLFVQEPFVFGEGWDNALVEELDGGVAVRFVDIDRLIAMKQGTGRIKDLDDIQHLEELRDDDA